MNDENRKNLWRLIQLTGDYLINKLPNHPNHPNGRNPYAHVALKIKILKAATEADALLGGAIKFQGEMLDPPMFGKALQTLLRAHALRALKDEDIKFTLNVLNQLPKQVIKQNWPYGTVT